ncbi:hypothetical protein E2320_001738 [Naja naja]|nr:hypothetical protein E2320_001738 [Naja naja]
MVALKSQKISFVRTQTQIKRLFISQLHYSKPQRDTEF